MKFTYMPKYIFFNNRVMLDSDSSKFFLHYYIDKIVIYNFRNKYN